LPSLSSSKISPAGLRGLTNKTILTVDPQTALTEAIQRLLNFEPEVKDKDWLVYNLHTNQLLQEGPQCGLVALTQALHVLYPRQPCVDQVQAKALELGFTKQGEMFSVDYMAQLAEDLGLSAEVSPVMPLVNADWLLSRLTAQYLLLVPYDCGPSHGPCLSKGRKAHWALITGVLVQSHDVTSVEAQPLTPELSNFFLLTRSLPGQLAGKVKVVARQSKSLVLGVWDAEELVSSCCNLKEVDEKRGLEQYMIPEGGAEKGLCGRMVILSKKSP
jgi:hypothetical protein